MGMKHQLSIVAVFLSMAMVGCGGGDGNSIVNMNANGGGNPSVNPGTPNPALTGTPSDGTFFNAEAGTDYASYLGGSLSNMSTRAVSSSSNVMGNASQNNDPASGLYNDDTSVEACDSGSISYSVGTNAADELENASIVFNNCVSDGQTATGSMSFAAQSSGNTDTISISFDNFATSGPEGDSSMDGDVSLSINEDLSASISGTSFTMVADGETVVFANYNLESQNDSQTGAASLGGQATITSSVNGQINFVINPAFVSSGEANPTSGVMTMTHQDGSSLTIDADTGDPATYAYIINGGGSITSGVGNWDDEDLEVPALN